MDPKNLSSLDPKLKEAYERVMGTSFTPPTQTKTPTVTTPPPPPPQQTHSETVVPQVPSSDVPHAFVAPLNKHNSPHNPAPITPTQHSETQKRKISPAILILAGVVFFVAYGVFWIKILNLKLWF